MSFTTTVKSEISTNELNNCCMRAECSAMLKMTSSLSFTSEGMHLSVSTENASAAKRMVKLMRELYDVPCQLSVIKKMKLKKNNIYVLRIKNRVKEILEDLELMDKNGFRAYPTAKLVAKECCARAYLAGAFLAGGSVNAPTNSNYHLEIATNDEKLANFIRRQMEKFFLPGKCIQRRNQSVVYLKSSEKIADFLKAIGAMQAVFEFEDVRIQRDFVNSLTRLDNCEFANEMKSLAAGKSQVEDIEYLENYGALEFLPEKIKQAAYLRKEHPEASLNELCDLFEAKYGETISKSGMRHRLNKMKEIASQYKQQ